CARSITTVVAYYFDYW
nr:immunoglobulin heavy chain junction region [Mus musculus]MBK4196565.1 immunoglobulin heavy chain junction region [Mus musculus]